MVHTQHQLEASWQAQAQNNAHGSSGDATSVADAGANKPLIRLVIPKIKLEAIVLEGTERQQLIAGPGHLTDTPMPGEAGNAVITAHRDTFFRHIFELEKGDEITIQRAGRMFRYEVTGKKVVQPNDLTVIAPTSDAQLTLITCYPIYYIGPAPERLVVSAKLVGPPGESPGTRPATMY